MELKDKVVVITGGSSAARWRGRFWVKARKP